MRTVTFLVAPFLGLFLVTAATAQEEPGAALAKALEASDTSACIEACRELSRLGPAAKPAVDELAKAMETIDDAELQRSAALALAAIGPDAKDAVPALISALKSKNIRVRAYAAHALGRIGPAAGDAAEPLIDLIVHEDPTVRREARDALRLINAPSEVVLPHVGKILSAADPADAAAAVITLAELGKEAVPGLCKALANDDTCYWAALTLGEIGPEAAAAVPRLSELLDHEDPQVRIQALVALGEIGPAAKGQAEAINEVLSTDPVEGVRYAAAFALGKIGEQSVARPALNAALDSDDPFLRVVGAWALLRLGKGDERLLRKPIQRVLEGLSSDDFHVRVAAAQALADDDVPDRLIAPAFAKAMAGLKADRPERLTAIVESFAALGPKAVRPCVISLQRKGPLRKYALQVLVRLGPDAVGAVPALTGTLEDPDPELRREALFALGAIGPAAATATAEITKRLSDDEEKMEVKHAACFALGSIGPAAKVALPELRRQLESDDEFQRVASVWAYLKILPDDAEMQVKAVPYLVEALANDRQTVRVEAAYMLGELASKARDAVPALKQALEDSNANVREAAATALKKIK